MTKYVYANLVDFLKQDAKIIKKYRKNNNLNLSTIQTELAKFFGYRHFHELETFHSKNNIFSSTETHLNKLAKDEFEELKKEYNELFISFLDYIKYGKNIFDKISPLWATTIWRDSEETIQYNMVNINYKFVFSNELFEEFMDIYAKENSYSDPYLKFNIINFNNLVFDILRFVKSDNYSRDYRKYINFVDMSKFLEENTNFQSVYLDNYNIYMLNCNEEIKQDQHGYMSMVFSEFCRNIFISTESNINNAIIVKDLIDDDLNHQFNYYDGLPKLMNIIFDHVASLVKKYDSIRINRLSNKDKIKLFSKKSTGIMISKKLNYDLIKEYLSAIDATNRIDNPSIWFIDNNSDEVKDIILDQKFKSTRAHLNSGNFVEQYYRVIKTAVDIIVINSEIEGFESKYVRQAQLSHLVFLLDPKGKFNHSSLFSEYDSAIELS